MEEVDYPKSKIIFCITPTRPPPPRGRATAKSSQEVARIERKNGKCQKLTQQHGRPKQASDPKGAKESNQLE